MTAWQLSADEHGILSAADARAAGLSATRLREMSRHGELTTLGRGWYAVGTPAGIEERHRLQTRAALRAFGGRVVAGHVSAGLLHGLPHYEADLSVVRLNRATPGAPRTRSHVRVGRTVPPESFAGDSVVPAMAVAQIGVSCGPLAALIAADSALHRRLTTPEELETALGWIRRHPGSGQVGSFLRLADGRRESPGETRLAHLLHLMGLPATPQLRVGDGDFTAYADFKLDDWPVLVEFDGRVKYADTAPGRGRGEALFAEKRREDRLRDLGYEVVRVVWDELDDPVALARRIRAAIDRARRRRFARSWPA